MVAWLTYTARVMAVSYFCLTPVGYFYHFRLLKNFKSQKKRKRTQRQKQFSTSKVKAKEETHKLTFKSNFLFFYDIKRTVLRIMIFTYRSYSSFCKQSDGCEHASNNADFGALSYF